MITINDKGFEQAKSQLADIIFGLTCSKKSESDFQKLKLLQARQNNLEFEMEISELICGDNNSFPYRSSFYLTKFFKDLGFSYTHDGSTRRFWVKDVLLSLNIHDFSLIIRKGLFNKRDFRKYTKEQKLDFDTEYKKAIKEFKEILNDSLEIDKGIDLSYLLDLNINVELLFDRKIKTKDNELDSLINEAKDRFFIPKDKQIALEKLWDAFERIKTYYGPNKKKSSTELIKKVSEGFNFQLIEDEFRLLTQIGNNYKIRHHETNKIEITNSKHIDYLFFRMLSLIDLSIKSIND